MTVRTAMINGGTDSAESFRLALGGLWVPASALNPRTGVTTTPVLTGTGNLTATVSPFTAMVDGNSSALQAGYPVALVSADTVTITPGSSQARIDLISLQILDNDYDSSGQHIGQLVVTAGTPSGSPAAPATPANAIPLWTISVPALATSVTWSGATAVFPYTAAAGGIVPARNASDKPAAAGAVQYRHRLDVTAAAGATSPLESSVDGTTWTPVYTAPGAWTAYTPTWTSFNSPQPSLGNGTITARYVKTGRLVTVQFNFTAGSTTTFGTGAWFFTFPVTSSAATPVFGVANLMASTGAATSTFGLVGRFSAGGFGILLASTNNYATPTSPFTFVSGSTIDATFTYESAS